MGLSRFLHRPPSILIKYYIITIYRVDVWLKRIIYYVINKKYVWFFFFFLILLVYLYRSPIVIMARLKCNRGIYLMCISYNVTYFFGPPIYKFHTAIREKIRELSTY